MIQFGTKYGPYGPSILHYKNTFGQVDNIVPSPYFTIFHRFSIISHHIVHQISEKTSPFTIFQHILGTEFEHFISTLELVVFIRTFSCGIRNLSRQGAGHHLHRKWRQGCQADVENRS